MCVYMYICMYLCMFVYAYVIYICIYICICVYKYINIYIYIYLVLDTWAWPRGRFEHTSNTHQIHFRNRKHAQHVYMHI